MPGPISHLLALLARERESQRLRLKHSKQVIRPPTQEEATDDHGTRYSIPQRVQALTLISLGWQIPDIEASLKIPQRTLRRIKQKAEERGYNPAVDCRILLHHVEDGRAGGRKKEIQPNTEQHLLNLVALDRAGREKSSDVLAYETGISRSSALRILHRYGLNSVKPTRKPGLTKAQRLARLEWCKAHQHWSLEDWKNVIWSDETSVVLNRRGTVRIWRRADESNAPSTIRNRWKGFSEFMFWGCFTWDSQGPCHIWKSETAKERKVADADLKARNEVLEPLMRAQWDLNTQMRRLGLRNKPGKKPQWSWNKKNGKLVRDGKSGIDWYRYSKV